MDALSVRVLGELSIDGLDVRAAVDRKARLLLRYLALARGRAVGTEALVDALWGDTPPAKPADQIAVLASRLRKALGATAIEHGDHGYRLAYDWLDLDELARLVAAVEERSSARNPAAAAAAARVAVSLLHGSLPEPDTEAEWVLADHAAAVRLVHRARRTAADVLLTSGDWLDALDLAGAAVQEDPYDEDAVRLVMRANAAGGRPAAALATYATLRELVADELGTDPAPETAALHEAILRGELVPATAVPAAAHLVGRASQLGHLDALADRVGDGIIRVAVVTGEGGIGKTTLLRAWSEARTAVGDIVLFGTCGTLDSSTPLDVLLAAIGEHLRRSDDPGHLLADDAALLGPLVGLGNSGEQTGGRLPDGVLGLASLYAAITGVLIRIGGPARVIVVLDDAYLAGPTLADWARFAERRRGRLLVVAAVRPAEGAPFGSNEVVNLGPLDRAAVTELVGADRAGDLHQRSGGHPLFLSELASAPDGELPASLVAAIERRCDDLGSGGDLIRSAAVLGGDLDVDLLASVLGRPPLDVLTDLETAADRNLLVETAGRLAFRHALVRQALADGARGSRAALLHREASAVLVGRPDADPVQIAEHARLGGDTSLAARSLREAAARAADRFDHATAEDLLDQSQRLAADDQTLLARARVRIRLGRYADAEADIAATSGGAEGHQLAAWAAYFDRRFDDAVRFAHDGEVAAEDPAVRARCQIVGARTLHARGSLDDAELLLTEAVGSAAGSDRLTASAWLGVIHAHRGLADSAIELLRPATRPGVHVDETSATLHAWLFTGHAHATAGRAADALAAFRQYTAEVERRQVPRFGGRGTNSAGWVLRNLGFADEAREAHLESLEYAQGLATPEVRVAALEDLADDSLLTGDLDAASGYLDDAAASLVGNLVFGWRLEFKLALLRARLALASGDAAAALAGATALRSAADAIGVPRYGSVARLLAHQAHAALGEPVDRDAVERDLLAARAKVAIEAWWWAGDTAAALGDAALLADAERFVDELARSSDRPDGVRVAADRRLDAWRLRTR